MKAIRKISCDGTGTNMMGKVNHVSAGFESQKGLVHYFLLLIIVIMMLSMPMEAADKQEGNLVKVGWLKNNLNNPDVLILDASPAQIYSVRHIPGAISVDVYTWYGLRELPLSEMESIYQSWGVSKGKRIVMYDQGANMLATRLFFSLLYHGYPSKDLLILDGGLFKWQEEGLPVTAEPTHVLRKGSFNIGKTNEKIRVRLPEFLTASGDLTNNVLLEALGADWHFGEVMAFDKAGHIPHAILLPSNDFFNPDKTFKSREEIKKMLTYLGIRPEQFIYTHCGGGVAASVPFFALKFIVDYPEVKLFQESQLGWLSDERKLPYWTYDAPALIREANWLQFWGGQIIRIFGGANISIVDVRSPNIYSKGHVTFATNIPAELFKTNLRNRNKMAEILSSSGVDPLHEAVIISDGGLTREAALAFVVLQEMGQSDVSILVDSMEDWSGLGFKLTQDSTIVSLKRTGNKIVIPPTIYPMNISKGVISEEANNTNGLFPKIFIAAGTNIPAKAPEGIVVHVPYTNLLNSDGKPKEAKDIWKILDKAGVPRYGELICFSDDPAESAINYFVLKLMGYPDIKILLL